MPQKGGYIVEFLGISWTERRTNDLKCPKTTWSEKRTVGKNSRKKSCLFWTSNEAPKPRRIPLYFTPSAHKEEARSTANKFEIKRKIMAKCGPNNGR